MIVHPAAHIVICITTFLRPHGLARLLDAVRVLIIPTGCRVRCVVVDNDPAGSARPIVDAARSAGLEGLDRVEYVVEPARGISQARNRAVREASGADWIAFLDDDDWPEPGWLTHLLGAQAATGADVVLGRGRPDFEGRPPDWVLDGRFFDRSDHQLEGEIPYWQAHTGGALIRASAFADLGAEPFDPQLGLVGGEDTAFFWDVSQRGARIVRTDKAVVNEGVAASRTRIGWLIVRAFRIGNSRGSLLVSRIYPRWHRRLRRVARVTWTAAGGIGLLLLSHGRIGRVRSLQLIAGSLGEAVVVLGGHFREYRRIHGS